MSDHHKEREAYLKALQSPPVLISAPGQASFSVPRELISWRSGYIRNALGWQKSRPESTEIKLQETTYETVQQFVIWAMPMYPEIRENVTFADILELAIFAEIHEVELLHNQSIDILREEIGKNSWKITPSVVKRAYTELSDGTQLRRLFGSLSWHARQDLGGSKEHGSAERDLAERWCEVFRLDSDVGRDYYLSSCTQRSIKQVKEGGPCRFHWHHGVDEKTLLSINSTSCPYVHLGQFPLGEWLGAGVSASSPEQEQKPSDDD